MSSGRLVRISDTNYDKLLTLCREFEEVTGKKFSFDDALAIVLLGSGLT